MKPTATVTTGDMRLLTAALPENSIDSCVTDPPYELNFMSAKWDNSGVAFSVDTWREVYRALKPGGYLLAFGAPRTYHRMAVAIEDAGFEIRDSLHWITGQGFPKSLDVSRAIDKAAGVERSCVGVKHSGMGNKRGDGFNYNGGKDGLPVTEPATDDARQWKGWGTALKPSHEPILVARKPFAVTVAVNVLEWGTGAINVDACRVGDCGARNNGSGAAADGFQKNAIYGKRLPINRQDYDKGRWPSNILLDSAAAETLDAQSRRLTSGKPCGTRKALTGFSSGYVPQAVAVSGYGDTGGTSRFFPVLDYEEGEMCPFLYTPKASQSERHAGTENGNNHPTVKPLAVMQWLCRLVTQPGGTVLDPFCGSGSTGIACLRENFNFIGFELREEAAHIARARMSARQSKVYQTSLFAEGAV